jgi:hypothetical protein
MQGRILQSQGRKWKEMKVFKWALFGVAGVAVAGFLAVTALGSGVSQAQEGDAAGHHGRPFLNALAGVLGITPSQLQDDRKAALDQVLTTAVANGRITQEQADQIKAHPRGAAALLRGAVLSVFESAADTLHLTKDQLRTEVTSGKSLADVAAEQNVSVEQLKAGMTAQIKTQLDQAVANGRIDQAKEDKILDGLSKRLDTIISRQGGQMLQP